MNNKPAPSHYPQPAKAWAALIILAVTYMFSFLDRQILVLLIEPIKTDLQISDTEVSLLTGFSFALVYAVMGIPMGRAADLWVRKYVVIIGVAIWSTLTLLCGFARNFSQLFIARMGVGLGEAALTPTAYSMISDLFPAAKLGKAMSVFTLGGVAAGTALSLFIGGMVIGVVTDIGTVTVPIIGELRPWQLVLVVVGFASLLMVIPLSLIKEPARQGLDSAAGQPAAIPFRQVLAYMNAHRAFYYPFIAASCLSNLFFYGSSAWVPSYFIRVYDWEASSTGMVLGLTFLGPAIIGGLLAGWLADRLYARGQITGPLMLYALVFGGLLVTVPLFIVVDMMSVKILLLALMYGLLIMYAVLFPTLIQLYSPNRMRGQISAIHLLALNIIGIGIGPTAVAVITDYGFNDEMAVGKSIAVVGVVAYSLAMLLAVRAIKPFHRQLVALNL